MMFNFFDLTEERKESLKKYMAQWVEIDENGCHKYDRTESTTGYGRIGFKLNGTEYRMFAHRLTWMLHYNSPIPQGLLCCHSCDERSCINPAHIFLGTAKINAQDMLLKDRKMKVKRAERLAMADAIAQGYTLREVGKRFNVAPQSVHEYLKCKEVRDKYGTIDLSSRLSSRRRDQWEVICSKKVVSPSR